MFSNINLVIDLILWEEEGGNGTVFIVYTLGL